MYGLGVGGWAGFCLGTWAHLPRGRYLGCLAPRRQGFSFDRGTGADQFVAQGLDVGFQDGNDFAPLDSLRYRGT